MENSASLLVTPAIDSQAAIREGGRGSRTEVGETSGPIRQTRSHGPSCRYVPGSSAEFET